MPPIPGFVHWHSLVARHAKSLKEVFARASRALDAQLSNHSQAQVQPILVRHTPKQPLHRIARIRQIQSRWYSTSRFSVDGAVRAFTSSSGRAGGRYDRSSFPKSRISVSISKSSGRTPFASTLRPNLTGGALGRTAGGYFAGPPRRAIGATNCASVSQGKRIQVSWLTSVMKLSTSGRPCGLA